MKKITFTRKPVYPEERLTFNEWAIYVKSQVHRAPAMAKVVRLKKRA